MTIPTPADIEAAIRRIALTPDGMLLYRHLQLVLMSSPTQPGSGALRTHEGRRSLARELKSLMDSELAKTGLPSDRSGAHDPDRPAIVEPGKPVAVSRPVLARRVQPYADSGEQA